MGRRSAKDSFMKTTKKHFDYFVQECKKRVNDFGLFSWDVVYYHERLDGKLAQCRTGIPDAQAYISLSTDWRGFNQITKEDLRFTAAHEVCHLLVARLNLIGSSRFCSESEMEEADEQIANNLVNFMRRHKII